MEKRLILAIVLSVLIVTSFQMLAPKKQVSVPQVTVPAGKAAVCEIAAEPPKPQFKEEEKTFSVENSAMIVTFSNIGGAIKSVKLKDYKDGSGDRLEIININDQRDYLLNTSSDFIGKELSYAAYSYDIRGCEVVFRTKINDFEIIKSYILPNDKYYIELRMSINAMSKVSDDLIVRVIGGSGIQQDEHKTSESNEVISTVNDKKVGFKQPKDKVITNLGKIGWSMLRSRYFCTIIKPLSDSSMQFYHITKSDGIVMGVDMNSRTMPGSRAFEYNTILYVGPHKESDLKQAGYGLEDTINYGFLGGIAWFLLAIMKGCYKIFHNWGIAIILTSVALNILLYPLSYSSFKSIKKMQDLQPEMEKLKVQYKNNKEKMNKEVMELYKKYKINPLGGCLPILLQMPIFFALYQAMMRSIELRGSGFLWIKDLSLPDAVKIPIELPILGNSINILPLIMLVLMVIQQKISTSSMGKAITDEQKQQQKMMLIMMPIMFGFIFYNMPSGLVLYWVVSTMLTSAEQYYIYKNIA